MKRLDVEIKVEVLKAKVRRFLRGKLETAVKKIQKVQVALGDPRVNKSVLLGPMVEMVYKDLMKAIDVVYVDSNSLVKDDVRKAVSAYIRSGEYGKPKPSPPVVVDRQSVSRVKFVPGPRGYKQPPPRKGSKAAQQQAHTVSHRSCKKLWKGRTCKVCYPTWEATPEQLEALKKALRVE